MTTSELNALMRQADDRKIALRSGKGTEYTRGDTDCLSNFKRAAQGLDVSPLLIWAVYAAKHWDAIMSYAKKGKEFSNENIEGRIDDLCVYLDLLRGLVYEHKEASVKAQKEITNVRQGMDPAGDRDSGGSVPRLS